MFFDDYQQIASAIEEMTAWVDYHHKQGSFDGAEGAKLANQLFQKADLLTGACAHAADCEYL